MEIESTVHWGALGGGLGWGKDLRNLLEQRLHAAEARIRVVVKGRWSVDVSSSILNILKLGVGGQVLKQPELRQELSQYSRNVVWAISINLQKSGSSHPKTPFFIKIQVLQIIDTHLGIRCPGGICADRALSG